MMRKSALAASIAALLTPALAGALGLGNIEVSSALNEPLQARIPLRGASAGEIEELRVALGDDQQFQRAGLDRVFLLTRLRFEVEQTSGASGYIRISTSEPIAEPFLNFLVDVNWPKGRVLREYTVLLDPPVYGSAITTGTSRSVPTVDSMRKAPAQAAAPAAEPAAAPTPTPPRAASTTTGSSAPAARWSGDSYGPVRGGETLWAIADRVRPAGTSIQNMMLALLRTNPEAFSINNINALRTGAVLRIPLASELAGGRGTALQEVARQHALWAEYRQTASSTVGAQPGGSTAAPAPGVAPASTQASATAQTGSGEESSELKLVGSGTTGSVTGGGADVDALRNQLTLAQEEAEAATQENEELRSRLGEVETLVDDLKRLVELKEDQLAALQDQLAKAGDAGTASGADATTTTDVPAMDKAASPGATEDQPVTGADKPEVSQEPAQPPPVAEKPKVEAPVRRAASPPPPPPKSFLEEIDDMLPFPLWAGLGGLGALVLAIGGLRFARGRKAKATAAAGAAAAGAAAAGAAPAMDDGASTIEEYAATELPADVDDEAVTEMPAAHARDESTRVEELPEGGAGQAATANVAAELAMDEDDPLAEVNVYLAYERFDQAEHLVRDAIASHPQRHDYKLKLLEVFYAAKNVAGFEAASQELRSAVGDGDPMMQQAMEWWDELGTGKRLFDGDDGPVTAETAVSSGAEDDKLFDVTTGEAGDGSRVDFDLGLAAAGAAAAGAGAAAAGDLDFDLGSDDDSGTGGSSVDFDLGDLAEPPTGSRTDLRETELDFELSAGDGTGVDTGLDFDLATLGATPASDDEGASLPERAGSADTEDGLDRGGLGDTGGAGAEQSSPDFDLSDTVGADTIARSSPDGGGVGASTDDDGQGTGLDFDLTETIRSTPLSGRDATPGEEDAAAGDAGLLTDMDFDLGDTTKVLDSTPGDGEGTGSVLDFDLGDTFGSEGSDASAEESDGGGSALDFDLGDAFAAEGSDAPVEEKPGGGSALDFDLGDAFAAEGSDAPAEEKAGGGSALDFDLGDAFAAEGSDAPADESAGGGSALDFDLGDTFAAEGSDAPAEEGAGSVSALDFDLGDTFAAEGSDAPAKQGAGADSGLDFDLSDTGTASRGVVDVGEESVLDFDLGDTSGKDADSASSGTGNTVDFDLGGTGAGGEATGGLDLELEVDDDGAGSAGGRSLDLDLTEGSADDSAAPGSIGAGPSGSVVDTVSLAPRPGAGTPSPEHVEGDLDFGVDTEFRDIFAADEASPGSESALDFDLDSTDGGGSLDADDTSAGADTQFMLQGDEDAGEDDSVLSLGSGEVDEMQTKLDLAQAYVDMGDSEGARNLLGEVMAEGSDAQQDQAREMLQKLS